MLFLMGSAPDANLFFLTMFWQHSQYDSRLGFSFRVLVRVRLGLELVIGLWLGLWLGLRVRVKFRVRVRVGFRVRVGIRVRIRANLTLTKTLKLNPNLTLSYWECCQNMVMKKNLRPGHRCGAKAHLH